MAGFAISPSWMRSIRRYADRLQADAQEASDKAVSFLHDRVRERAQQTPEWSDLADNIEVWSKDGKLYVGINNLDYVSQAMAIEYGDEVRPPNALFRTLASEFKEMGDVAQGEMEAKGYVYGAGIGHFA